MLSTLAEIQKGQGLGSGCEWLAGLVSRVCMAGLVFRVCMGGPNILCILFCGFCESILNVCIAIILLSTKFFLRLCKITTYFGNELRDLELEEPER